MGDFQGGRKIETSFPLEWRFWLLLSLLTKVTRRRHPAPGRGTPLPFGKESNPSETKKGKGDEKPSGGAEPRPYAPSTDNLCVYVTGRTESSSPTKSPNPLRIRHTHKKRRPPAGGLPVLYLYITPPSQSVHSRRCCGDRPRRRCSSRCCGTRRTSAPADSSAKWPRRWSWA